MAPYITGDALTTAEPKELPQWNQTLPSTVERCIHHLVEERARQQPDAEALCSAAGSLTYKALDAYATIIARKLLILGARPNTYVALSFEHSIWAVVAMLGVLKAGAAFSSMPPSPHQRIENILEQMKPIAVLASPLRASSFMQYPQPTIVVSQQRLGEYDTLDYSPLTAQVTPVDLAYAVFTSGSTGMPKGAHLEHRQLCTYVIEWARAAGIDANTRQFQYSSYLFDVHVSDIFTPLSVGGTICIPSEHDRFNNIARSMRDLSVTHAMFVPSLLSTLSPEDVDLETFETLMMIGEKSPAHIVERWASIPGLRVINAYGPAECTPVSSVLDMSLDGAISGNIGRPMGACLWIVNPLDAGELLPLGQEGELLIEGPLVGRGYMNDAEKTAAVFIPAPAWLKRLRSGASPRVYRTGDLCRYTKNGTIDYIGRSDLQVKIRGQRMELGEVEYHLRRVLPRSADLAVELSVKQSKLVAFISLKPIIAQQQGSAVSENPDSIAALEDTLPNLKKELFQSLPEYMVPSTFVAMDFIPRLASAKTDRNTLRAIAATLPSNTSARVEVRLPTSAMEEKLRQVWAGVFGLELKNIGIDDHFFHLGGDSITAIRMRVAARASGIELSMKDVFDHLQLAELAAVARAAGDNHLDVGAFELIMKDSLGGVLQSDAAQCGVTENEIEDIYPAAMNACYFMLTSEAAPNWWTSYHVFPLPADVDMARYLDCWKFAISSYQNLRSRIIRTETAILQVVLREEKEPIRSAENLDLFIEQEKQTTMNWGESLSRYCVVEDKGGQCYFVWTAKQAIFDAWSLHMMSQNIAKVYFSNGFTMVDILKPNQLAKHKKTADITPAKTWFNDHFAGVKPDPIFSTPPDYKFETDVYESRDIKFPHSLSSTGFTLSTVSAVAWALVLGQHTGSDDVCLGLVRSGRDIPLPSTDKYMGPLTSLMPLRVLISGSTLVHKLLQKYQSDFTESSAYDAWSYIELIMDAELDPRIKGAVTSTVSLNIVHPLDYDDSAQQLPPHRELPAGATQKPLNLNVFLKSDGSVRVMTRRDHIACTEELAKAFVNSFELVAGQLMMADRETTVGQLDVPDTSGIKRSYLSITDGVQHEDFQKDTDALQHGISAEKDGRIDLSALRGKSVLITGGASGLGLATTSAFAAAGAYVTIADIQSADDVGAKLIEDFKSQGHHVTYAHCDVTNFASQVSAFKHAVQFAPTKSLDIVALFAGVTAEHGNIMDHLVKITPSLKYDPPPPQIQCLNINLLGVYYSAYLALNYFRLPSGSPQPTDAPPASTDRSLIFVNSLAGYLDFSHHTTYSASKFGARGIFRSIRSETKQIGVRCNLIAPWLVRTPLTRQLQHRLPGSAEGISWSSVEDVVECVGRVAVDEKVNGRAFAVMPEGAFDLNDDLEGGFAGEESRNVVLRRKKAGDLMV